MMEAEMTSNWLGPLGHYHCCHLMAKVDEINHEESQWDSCERQQQLMAPAHICTSSAKPRKIMHGMAGNTLHGGGRLFTLLLHKWNGMKQKNMRGKTAPLITPWESNNTNFLKLSDWFTFVISSMNIGIIHTCKRLVLFCIRIVPKLSWNFPPIDVINVLLVFL